MGYTGVGGILVSVGRLIYEVLPVWVLGPDVLRQFLFIDDIVRLLHTLV